MKILAACLVGIAHTYFTFMAPILAGFIVVSIADSPGLAPGLIGGYIADRTFLWK